MLKENELQIRPDLKEPGPKALRRPEPILPVTQPSTGKHRGSVGTWIIIAVLVVIIGYGVHWLRQGSTSAAPKAASGKGKFGPTQVPVVAGKATVQDVPVYLDGLGTVQAFNTVSIRSRVDGAIEKILFAEGQDVHAGDLLAQIDPAPFQAQLDQNIAKKAQDEAQLALARITLKRDADLLANKILAQQDYDTQAALVQQLVATVQTDEAAIESARVQLNYTKITSPLDGRVGVRMVDPGNIVHASDSNAIVVVTQLRPIAVIFTIAEQFLGDIQKHVASGDQLTVIAIDRDNEAPLGDGKLAVVNNQIDTTTGTIQLKAYFPNQDLRLWPGQFVNARLLLTTVKSATVVPAQAVQRGPEGDYVFVVKPDVTVDVRPVKTGPVEQGMALIQSGLNPGDQIVIDGQYKLQRGSKVKVGESNPASPGGRGGKRPPAEKSKAP